MKLADITRQNARRTPRPTRSRKARPEIVRHTHKEVHDRREK